MGEMLQSYVMSVKSAQQVDDTAAVLEDPVSTNKLNSFCKLRYCDELYKK